MSSRARFERDLAIKQVVDKVVDNLKATEGDQGKVARAASKASRIKEAFDLSSHFILLLEVDGVDDNFSEKLALLNMCLAAAGEMGEVEGQMPMALKAKCERIEVSTIRVANSNRFFKHWRLEKLIGAFKLNEKCSEFVTFLARLQALKVQINTLELAKLVYKVGKENPKCFSAQLQYRLMLSFIFSDDERKVNALHYNGTRTSLGQYYNRFLDRDTVLDD